MRGWVPSVVVVGCLMLTFGASEVVAQATPDGIAPPAVLSSPPAEPDAPDADAPDANPPPAKADDDAKNDTAKNDTAKNDTAKNDNAKNDNAKNDNAKNDNAKNDTAKNDNAKNDNAKNNGAVVAPPPLTPLSGIDPSDAPDAFADDFEDGDDDTLSFDPTPERPPEETGAYGTSEPRPPPVPTAEVDPIPVAAYGIIGLVIGLAAPVAIGSLGGLALVSVANDNNATCDSCGIIILGFLGLGVGVIGSGPLGVAGATAGTVFGQLSKGTSMLPSLGGGAAGLGVMGLGIVAAAIGIPLAAGLGDIGGGPAADAAIAAALGVPALLFVLSGPAAVAVTALIELTFASNAPPAERPTAVLPSSLAAPRQASVRY